MPKEIPPKVLTEFQDLWSGLQDENLYEDGEISNDEAYQKEIILLDKWRKLEFSIERKVSQEEIGNNLDF